VGLALALVCFWPVDPSRHLTAQTVRGVLLESGTRRALEEGTVILLDVGNRAVDRAVTDDDGSFRLEAPAPGDYYLKAERLGYRTTVDGILELGEGGRITVDFYLRPRPLELDSLRAEGEASGRLPALEDVGFYERMEANPGGYFFPPARIHRQLGVRSADILRSVPRVVIKDRAPMPSVWMRGGANLCTPQIWIDGVRRESVSFLGGLVLEELVAMQDVEAMEVYPGAASTPSRYGGANGACGTVIVWTRHLERRPGA
jgi:hypothetical protein